MTTLPTETSERTEPGIRGLLRTVNEHVTRLGESVVGEFDYVCECTNVHCKSPVRLTAEAYARVTSNPGWFVVAPGHVQPEERIVERGRAHAVVTRRP